MKGPDQLQINLAKTTIYRLIDSFFLPSLRGAKRRGNPGRRHRMDCFASLAMTILDRLSRSPKKAK